MLSKHPFQEITTVLKRCLAAFSVTLFAAAAWAAPAHSAVPAPASAPDADDELIALGHGIPGFGGMFHDAEGALHVYMLNPTAGGASIEKALGEQPLLHRADFTFERLVAWKRALVPVLSIPGVLSLDADEAHNRVTIGVARDFAAADRERLDAALDAGGVPRTAVRFQEGEPFTALPLVVDKRAAPSAGVQDKVRPVPGGVQVAFGCTATSCFICTDGFTAMMGKTLGFVINSHCTGERGAVDFMRYSQSLPNGGIVGTEIADAPLFPCAPERRCRFSDAAFVKFDKKSYGSFARIAKPNGNDPDFGSLVMTPGTARFVVGGAAPSPLTGDIVHKVGRTTGWTYGEVVNTCITVNVGDSDLTYQCQTAVAAGAGGGDSGSPVFTWNGGTTALLQGILWGGGALNGQSVFVFSSLGQIQQELGTLKIK